MNQKGGMLIGALFLVAFVALVSIPVMQTVAVEYRGGLNQQLAVKAQFLAEAGLSYGEAAIRQGLLAVPELPAMASSVLEHDLGNGSSFRVKLINKQAAPGVYLTYLVSEGQVGKARKAIGLLAEELPFTKGALTLCSSTEDMIVEHNKPKLTLKGNLRSNSSLIATKSYSPSLTITDGGLILSGSFEGNWVTDLADKKVPAPTFNTSVLEQFVDEFYFDKYDTQLVILVESKVKDKDMLAGQVRVDEVPGFSGNTYNVSGVTYWDTTLLDQKDGKVTALQNVTFTGSGTLIVKGDFSFKEVSGTVNLIVDGDITQTTGGYVNDSIVASGLIYCSGKLESTKLVVKGAVVANTLVLSSSFDTLNIDFDESVIAGIVTEDDALKFIDFSAYSETIWPN